MPIFVGEDGVKRLWSRINDLFVKKEDGKELSENNFSNEYKTELDNLITNAATKSEVDSAIASAITTTLNTEV